MATTGWHATAFTSRTRCCASLALVRYPRPTGGSQTTAWRRVRASRSRLGLRLGFSLEKTTEGQMTGCAAASHRTLPCSNIVQRLLRSCPGRRMPLHRGFISVRRQARIAIHTLGPRIVMHIPQRALMISRVRDTLRIQFVLSIFCFLSFGVSPFFIVFSCRRVITPTTCSRSAMDSKHPPT